MGFINDLDSLIFPRFSRIKELVRKYPKQSIVFAVAIIIFYTSAVFTALYFVRIEKEKQRSTNLSYAAQLNNLKQTESTIKNLLNYIENQKSKLQESEDILNNLRSEKKRLEPLVNADRDVVKAMFEYQDRSQKNERWIGYIASFILGILSSLMATVIVYAIKSSKNKKATGTIGDSET